MNGTRSIEKIIRETDARQQIHDAIMRYCRGVDHCDLDLVLSAYHPGARDEHGFFSGTAEDFAKAAMAAGASHETIRHSVCNEYVEFDAENAELAYSETVSVGTMLSRDGKGYRLMTAACRFLDIFEQRNGDWKITKRRVVLDWETEGSAQGLAGGTLTTGMLRGFASGQDPSFNLGFRVHGDHRRQLAKEVRVGNEQSEPPSERLSAI